MWSVRQRCSIACRTDSQPDTGSSSGGCNAEGSSLPTSSSFRIGTAIRKTASKIQGIRKDDLAFLPESNRDWGASVASVSRVLVAEAWSANRPKLVDECLEIWHSLTTRKSNGYLLRYNFRVADQPDIARLVVLDYVPDGGIGPGKWACVTVWTPGLRTRNGWRVRAQCESRRSDLGKAWRCAAPF